MGKKTNDELDQKRKKENCVDLDCVCWRWSS